MGWLDSMVKRIMSRFYDYPPILLENTKDIFSKDDIAVYTHIPFCTKICNYCPYIKYVRSESVKKKYVSNLIKEIRLFSNCNKKVKVIYIGGGTPSLLSSSQIKSILNEINKKFEVDKDCQISIECNPIDADLSKIKSLYKVGVNRISFGIQSFHDDLLKILGRAHDRKAAINAIKNAKLAGFKDINIDLMYRLPGQTLQQWKEDLLMAKKLKITHLSTLALDIVRNTKFYILQKKGLLGKIPSPDTEIKMFRLVTKILNSKDGYKRYNVDQIAFNNKKNRYGIYVAKKEVVGFGAGALSFFNEFVYQNEPALNNYFEKIKRNELPIILSKKLTKKEIMQRYIIKSILYSDVGINKHEFEGLFGVELKSVFARQLSKLVKQGLLTERENSFVITSRGYFLIQNICHELYDQEYKDLLNSIIQFQKGVNI